MTDKPITRAMKKVQIANKIQQEAELDGGWKMSLEYIDDILGGLDREDIDELYQTVQMGGRML